MSKKKVPLFLSFFIFGSKILFLNLSVGNNVKKNHLFGVPAAWVLQAFINCFWKFIFVNRRNQVHEPRRPVRSLPHENFTLQSLAAEEVGEQSNVMGSWGVSCLWIVIVFLGSLDWALEHGGMALCVINTWGKILRDQILNNSCQRNIGEAPVEQRKYVTVIYFLQSGQKFT